MSEQFKIEGLEEVSRKLKALADPKKAKNAAKRSVRQAMKVVVEDARKNALRIDDPATREAIYKNVAYREGRMKSVNWIKGRVGVLGGASSNKYSKEIIFKERKKKGEAKQDIGENQVALPGGNTKHFKFIEFGTSKMPATPFLRPALENNIQVVTNRFAESFKAELDKELAKL